ncbi:hypothetical protein HON17_01360 [bacterium]|nr:hypothetical protein [bacterium]
MKRLIQKSLKTVQLCLMILILAYNCGFCSNVLTNIEFEEKENGIIVEFEFIEPISSDSVYAWQSDNQWFYFTLHNILSDTFKLDQETTFNLPILDFQPIISSDNTQIGLRLKKRVDSFEFYNQNQKNLLNAHLHYSLDNFDSTILSNTKTKKVRVFDSLFARSKSWLFILASGYSIASLINDKDTKINVEAGIITLILSYLINKSWTNN